MHLNIYKVIFNNIRHCRVIHEIQYKVKIFGIFGFKIHIFAATARKFYYHKLIHRMKFVGTILRIKYRNILKQSPDFDKCLHKYINNHAIKTVLDPNLCDNFIINNEEILRTFIGQKNIF